MSDIPPTPETQAAELAATLHDLADRVADYDGELPGYMSLTFAFLTFDERHVDTVDQLATTLIGQTGEAVQRGGNWQHRAETERSGLKVSVYTDIPAPAEEDPAALRARIAELQAENARLAEGGGQNV